MMFRPGIIAVVAMLFIAAAPIPSSPSGNPGPENSQSTYHYSASDSHEPQQAETTQPAIIVENPTYNLHPAAEQEQHRPFYKQWDFWVAIATLALVVATLALAVPAWLGLSDTRRIGEAQVRAYVAIEKVWVDFIDVEKLGGVVPNFNVKAVNTGQSPAKEFRWRPAIEYSGDNLEKLEGDYTKTQRAVATIGPTIPAHGHVTESLIVPKLAPEAYAATSDFLIEQFLIRIRIDFSYLDVFGKRLSDSAQFAGHMQRKPSPDPAHQWLAVIGPVNQPGKWEDG